MGYKVIFGFVSALFVSGGLGWLAAGSGPVASGVASVNEWDSRAERVRESIDRTSNKPRVDALLASRFLPVSASKSVSDVSIAAAQSTAGEDFPKILGVATVNGESQVHLLVAEKVIAKVSGDRLVSGWEIISVDMEEVVASLRGDTTIFPIIEY